MGGFQDCKGACGSAPGRPLTDGGQMDAAILETKGICVDFPGVRALDHVDFRLTFGEIHALVGANGARQRTVHNAT